MFPHGLDDWDDDESSKRADETQWSLVNYSRDPVVYKIVRTGAVRAHSFNVIDDPPYCSKYKLKPINVGVNFLGVS